MQQNQTLVLEFNLTAEAFRAVAIARGYDAAIEPPKLIDLIRCRVIVESGQGRISAFMNLRNNIDERCWSLVKGDRLFRDGQEGFAMRLIGLEITEEFIVGVALRHLLEVGREQFKLCTTVTQPDAVSVALRYDLGDL